MALKAAIHQYLATRDGVTSLVPAARIFRGRRTANTALPSITYWRISEVDENHQEAACGKAQARIQFDVWAATDSGAEAIWSALRTALHWMNNTSIGSGGDATWIDKIECENTMDIHEWPQDASDVHVYQISMDAMIVYRTSVPTF